MQQPALIHSPTRNTWYRLDARIDTGGEGEVWAGMQLPSLPVAIKIIHPTTNAHQAFGSWFRDQDVHLKCIRHPNVVQTYDQFFSRQYGWVLVMERAQGNLEQTLCLGKPLDSGTVYSFGCQLLWGLHHLHTVRVIHRDLKPKNILVFADGVVKINDFGVAKTDVSIGEITRTLLGTRQYLPPELHKLGHWSHRSDIYQVGLVLLSLLLGRHVIPTTADERTAKQMITDGVPRQIAEYLISSHGDLAKIIYFMVCRTESLRYNTALAARHDLWNAWTTWSSPMQPTQARALNSQSSGLNWLASLHASSSSR